MATRGCRTAERGSLFRPKLAASTPPLFPNFFPEACELSRRRLPSSVTSILTYKLAGDWCMTTAELAARCAVMIWFKKEGPLVQSVQVAEYLDQPLVKRWLSYWMVARTVSRQNRAGLSDFLHNAKSRLICPSPISTDAFSIVEELADEGGRLPVFNGRPISLVSKFAFSCRPDLFSPTDSRARKGLGALGYRVKAQDYVGFMQAFNEQKIDFAKKCWRAGIVPENLIFNGNVMPNALFERRSCDRYLMLLGGFSEELMRKRIRAADFG